MIKSVTIEITVDVICDVIEERKDNGTLVDALKIYYVKLGNTDITQALEQTNFEFDIIERQILDEL